MNPRFVTQLPSWTIRRIFLLIACASLLSACAASTERPLFRPKLTAPERTAFTVLYRAAPELRKERLELVNNVWTTASPYREVHADFRYLDDPKRKSRILILRRSSSFGTVPKVTLESGFARWHFRRFPDGGGQEQWTVYSRRPYVINE